MAARLHLAPSSSEEPEGEVPAESTTPISVVVADDHALMRRTLRELLDAEPHFEVIAEAEDVVSAARHLDEHRPQVLVLDVSMPDSSCRQAIGMLRARAPATQIVVLTTDDSAVLVQRILAAGALGYVLKELADSELPDAVRAVAEGEEYVSPRVSARLDELYSALTDDRISPREVEVLRLIALGHTSVEIARKLQLSPRTIETHRAHIHQKLGLATRAELVRYALRRGLLRS
ncbi:MAG TPA: response regulator transcription factor [Solirubrobacteraceae bacterium]|nr:response regulator transcription factor [Solirubrobacteraceae bacterium]